MKPIQCDNYRFLKDTIEHQIITIRDDGIHRHIRFKKPGTICYSFDLITWPGHLCISGDCGTYVFQRIEDMFEFFRGDGINPGYWGEKLLSVGTNAGYKEYSSDLFTAAVKEDITHWEYENDEQKYEVLAEVKSQVLDYAEEGEHFAYHAAYEYRSDYDHSFEDFFEHSFTEYTWSYLWCLYAINWGICQYDSQQDQTTQDHSGDE